MNKEEFEKAFKLFQNTLNDIKYLLENDKIAQEMYASLCNIIWVHVPTGLEYSCSWRFAGGLIAGYRTEGENYMDFYCSGIVDPKGTPEGKVTWRINKIMREHGWRYREWGYNLNGSEHHEEQELMKQYNNNF